MWIGMFECLEMISASHSSIFIVTGQIGAALSVMRESISSIIEVGSVSMMMIELCV